MTTPEEVAQAVREHFEKNPTHGHNCTCLDRLIGELRMHLNPFLPSITERVEARFNERKVHNALHYVLHIASKPRMY